jgi:hypothetical protein
MRPHRHGLPRPQGNHLRPGAQRTSTAHPLIQHHDAVGGRVVGHDDLMTDLRRCGPACKHILTAHSPQRLPTLRGRCTVDPRACAARPRARPARGSPVAGRPAQPLALTSARSWTRQPVLLRCCRRDSPRHRSTCTPLRTDAELRAHARCVPALPG